MINSVKRFTREHNGVNYYGVEDRERMVTGIITKGDKKWELRGYPKINKTKGSYKYDKEIQITIWNKAGSTKEKKQTKYAKNWDTVEVFLKPKHFWQLMVGFFKYFKEEEKID